MIKKKVIDKGRIRRIDGGFAFIPHRFLTDGFVSDLSADQLRLYFFLVLAADQLRPFLLQLRQDLQSARNESGPVCRSPLCVDQKEADRF